MVHNSNEAKEEQKEMRICHEYYIRLDCAQKLFGKHEYITVSISHLTNNCGRADPKGRMGGD